MPEKIIKWKCLICSQIYEKEDDAIWCEAGHPIDPTVEPEHRPIPIRKKKPVKKRPAPKTSGSWD